MNEPIVIRVEGMTCGHCEMAVKHALGTLEGVVSVEASRADGQVRIEVGAGAAIDELRVRELIEEEGFVFAGVVGGSTPA